MKMIYLLLKARKYQRKSIFLQGLFLSLFMTFILLFSLFVLDNLLRLPAGIRIFLGIFSGLMIGKEICIKVFLPLLSRHNKERMAVYLEEKYQIPENLLINACHFQNQDLLEQEKVFAMQTIQQGESAIQSLNLESLLEKDKIRKRLFCFSGAFFIFALYAFLFPLYLQNAFYRYLYPQKDIPPIGRFSLSTKPDSDIILAQGDSLEIECVVQSRSKNVPEKNIPVFVYQEDKGYLEASPHFCKKIEMKKQGDLYKVFLPDLKTSFCWRIFMQDTYTPSLRVQVIPFPRIQLSSFRIQEPEYAGAREYEYPGPPASITALSGSRIFIKIQTDTPVAALFWQTEEEKKAMELLASSWTTSLLLEKNLSCQTMAKLRNGKEIFLAQSEIYTKKDQLPQVAFLEEDLHLVVSCGKEIKLSLQASDDYGIQYLGIQKSLLDETAKGETLKEWIYLGPPGSQGPIKEFFSLQIDLPSFQPGKTYLLEGVCKDFCPGERMAKSKPVILKIKSWEEESLPPGDEMSKAFDFLRETIAEQKKSLSLTENLQAYLLDALKENTLGLHQKEMDKQQKNTKNKAIRAVYEFEKYEQGKQYAKSISSLVDKEMKWLMDDIIHLKNLKSSQIKDLLGKIEERQLYILKELMALLGKMSEKQKESVAKKDEKDNKSEAPLQESLKNLQDDLKDFARAERTILEKSKTLLDKTPEDLTQEEEKILGELAREQEKWSKFLEEKLTDFSKLPPQDFSDSSLAQEFNEVYQEVQLAAKALYEKKIELAVPHEQSGLEKAETLVHNLEKWLQDTPDHTKWLMEEPQAQEDIPLAELPKELEDIVGELLDKEEEMGEDVEDASSSWLDSLDKGAGWDAMDGPISNMSAKGVTGNLLPNKNEIAGRSGEGRTGKSHGQMVEKTAQGKGGRETPTRLSPGPFEQGSVEDSSKDSTGGSTGGGKLSGFSEEGLIGPSPSMLMQKMARLAENQIKIRQKAEKAAIYLKKYKIPTGDLEMAIAQMKNLEESAQKGQGDTIRSAHHKAIDALAQAKKSAKSETGLKREQTSLPGAVKQEILEGYKEGFPKSYEEIIKEYFKKIAQE
ncbi:MAG: hypothetical protein HUU50_07650 [Candidatus Brocadiae bacterium]|nr:hypothetical protein [Candidatus Brocadiia bacterium]